MNEINASKRLKYAVAERAEGDKILQVKSAEADAEAKYLSGVGVAKQRKAIVDVRCSSALLVLVLALRWYPSRSQPRDPFLLHTGFAPQYC